MVLSLLIIACTSSEAPQPAPSPVVPASAADGWIEELITNPQLFTTLMASGERDAWIAFHRSDFSTAADFFDEHQIARARAELHLSVLFEDLDRLSALAFRRTFSLWAAKSSIPRGSALPVVAALAASSAGDSEGRKAWLERAAPQSADVRSMARKLEDDVNEWKTVTPREGPLVTCVMAHLEARRQGDVSGLAAACPAEGPFVREQANGHQRVFYNPLTYKTLASVHRTRAHRALGTYSGDVDPSDFSPLAEMSREDRHRLESMLFGPWWTRQDLEADLERDPDLITAGATGPTLIGLGLTSDTPVSESPQWARNRVRELDTQLASWRKEQERLPEAGQELLRELRIIEQYRSRILTAWARSSLLEDRPSEALAFLTMALDVERGREISPINTPSLFALLAEANLRSGRTRQSLDALQVLVDQFPDIEGLDETIGDLAILEGLDRHGDSKEN